MALNIKTEPCEGTSNIVDLSSDTDVPLEVPEMKPPEHPPRPGTPDTHCSICLEELNNKCHSDACWHKFCFECLKRWSLVCTIKLLTYCIIYICKICLKISVYVNPL